jgi:hypothetical protein
LAFDGLIDLFNFALQLEASKNDVFS